MDPNRSHRRFDSRLFISGAVLTGIGGTLAMLGVALGSAAVIEAGLRWQRSTQMTPVQLARHALGSAQVASTAGAQAWRAPMPAEAAPARSGDGRREPVS